MKKEYFRNLFNFNKQDRRGLSFLLTILLLDIFFYVFIDSLVINDNNYDFSTFDQKLEQFKNEVSQNKLNLKSEEIHDFNKSMTLFDFDPNTVSEKELMDLGWNKFQIQNLLKYRKKGGIFKRAEDIRKIYGINESYYNVLKPYIVIESKKNTNKIKNCTNFKDVKLELNSVDIIKLKKVEGINSIIARRIINYRNLLGGFHSFDQLYEVYDIDTNNVIILTKCSYIDTSTLQKININNATKKELLRIPYLSRYHVDAIIRFKEINKNFDSVSDLFNYNLLDHSTFEKAAHYIDIQ